MVTENIKKNKAENPTLYFSSTLKRQMEKSHKLFLDDINADISEMLNFYLENPTHERLFALNDTYDLSMISKMYIEPGEHRLYMKMIFMIILDRLDTALKKIKNHEHLALKVGNERFSPIFYVFLLNQVYFGQAENYVLIEIGLDLLERATSYLADSEYSGYLDDLKEVKAFSVAIDTQYQSFEVLNEISSEVDEIEILLDKDLI